jgi:hypothetical protein
MRFEKNDTDRCPTILYKQNEIAPDASGVDISKKINHPRMGINQTTAWGSYTQIIYLRGYRSGPLIEPPFGGY